MSLLSKLFGDAAKGAVASVEKKITKDVVEATIAGSLLVAAANDGISDEELGALEVVLGAADEFKPWEADFQNLIGKYATQLMKAPRLGKMTALREIGDLRGKNPDDAELVMNCILTVADASGAIEAEERKVLGEIASVLGVNLSKFGV